MSSRPVSLCSSCHTDHQSRPRVPHPLARMLTSLKCYALKNHVDAMTEVPLPEVVLIFFFGKIITFSRKKKKQNKATIFLTNKMIINFPNVLEQVSCRSMMV